MFTRVSWTRRQVSDLTVKLPDPPGTRPRDPRGRLMKQAVSPSWIGGLCALGTSAIVVVAGSFLLTSLTSSAGATTVSRPSVDGQFAYVNVNRAGPNQVAGYRISSGGALTRIGGSPWKTGGTGLGHVGFFAGISEALSPSRGDLYVLNEGDLLVSGFSISPVTGALRQLPGSPYRPKVPGQATFGDSLAVDTTLNEVIVAAGNAGEISTLPILANGSLGRPTVAYGYPQKGADGIALSSGGAQLAIADYYGIGIDLFSLRSGGVVRLEHSYRPNYRPTSVAFSPNGAELYTGSIGHIGSYRVAAGRLTVQHLLGTPGGFQSISLSDDGAHIYASDPKSPALCTVVVGSGGRLTRTQSCPVVTSSLSYQGIVSATPDQQEAFSVDGAGQIFAYRVAPNATLTAVPGSPFARSTSAANSANTIVTWSPVSLSSSRPTRSLRGQAVTFTTTASPVGGGIAQFEINGRSTGKPVHLSGGIAKFTSRTLGTGRLRITAVVIGVNGKRYGSATIDQTVT